MDRTYCDAGRDHSEQSTISSPTKSVNKPNRVRKRKIILFKAPNKSINITYDPEGKDMPCILNKQQLVEQYKFYFRSLTISKPCKLGAGKHGG